MTKHLLPKAAAVATLDKMAQQVVKLVGEDLPALLADSMPDRRRCALAEWLSTGLQAVGTDSTQIIRWGDDPLEPEIAFR